MSRITRPSTWLTSTTQAHRAFRYKRVGPSHLALSHLLLSRYDPAFHQTLSVDDFRRGAAR
jgi:hypothetical protein